MSKLRCHLLIGPPASGKTSLSKILAPIVNAKVLSTDAIREELWGDEMSQGPWEEIEELLHARLKEHVSKGQSVIIDATHAKRSWRLTFTQKIRFEQPIEWIGWWIKTPPEVCLKWNQKRERIIEEEVIHQYCAALQDKNFNPNRDEGFASIVEFDPSLGANIDERLNLANNKLTRNIKLAENPDQNKELHGYSRLLDLERLLFLTQLLSHFPGLSASDEQTRKELETICNPLPQGSMSERASVLLSAMHEIAKKNPEKEITLITATRTKADEILENDPYIKKIIFLDKDIYNYKEGFFSKFFKLKKFISKENFSKAFIMHYGISPQTHFTLMISQRQPLVIPQLILI